MSIAWNIQNGELDAVKQSVKEQNLHEVYNGRTAIQIAADYGQTAVMEYLISIGADVQAKDKYGITPLLSAVWEGHYDAVKLLLQHGADRSIIAPDGTSLIDCSEDEKIRELLKS
uniref:ANK_REP_REGION domain-containing protein n=1 Tax=Caenorhabditis tropicalis TaxID=1561998 RepID=A0A1I7TCN0_9PELO